MQPGAERLLPTARGARRADDPSSARHVERAMAATPADGEVKHAQPPHGLCGGKGQRHACGARTCTTKRQNGKSPKRQSDKAAKQRSGKATKQQQRHLRAWSDIRWTRSAKVRAVQRRPAVACATSLGGADVDALWPHAICSGAAREQREAGFKPHEMLRAGFSMKDLREAGVGAKEMMCSGSSSEASANERSRISLSEWRDAGYSATELKLAGMPGW